MTLDRRSLLVSGGAVLGGALASSATLGAQNAGVGGIYLAVGDQDAIQTVQAGQQLDSSLLIGASLGSFSQKAVSGFGDYAKKMEFMWAFAPDTVDIPVYQALRADLSASGEQSLQPENLKSSAQQSWIGLYAFLRMIRDAHMTSFTRQGITQMLKSAKDVPMLGIFGGENWTPNLNHAGMFQRAGMNHWQVFSWDPNATSATGVKGNFVPGAVLNWDKTVCGSIFGSSGPC